MKKLKSTLIACFLVVSPMVCGAEKDSQAIEKIPQSLRSYWESIITSPQYPETIVFDPSFPEAIENAFCHESSNPDSSIDVMVSPGSEEQYMECLLQYGKGSSTVTLRNFMDFEKQCEFTFVFHKQQKIQKTKELGHKPLKTSSKIAEIHLKNLREPLLRIFINT